MAVVVKSIYYSQDKSWDHFSLLDHRGDAVYHFSLRPDVRIIVFNAMHKGRWGTQTEIPFSLQAVPIVVLTSIIEGSRAFFLVNGELLNTYPLDRQIGNDCRIDTTMPYTWSERLWRIDQAPLVIDGIETAGVRGYRLVAPDWTPTIKLKATVGRSHFIGNVQWIERPELTALAEGDMQVKGWIATFPEEFTNAIAAAIGRRREATRIVVDIGDAQAMAWTNPPGAVEKCHDFQLLGWVDRPSARRPSVELLVNGRLTPATVKLLDARWFESHFLIGRPTEVDASGSGRTLRPIKFSMALSPVIWRRLGGDESLDLQVKFDGAELFAGRLILSRRTAAQWAEPIILSNARQNELSEVFEHVFEGRLGDLLSDQARERFQAYHLERLAETVEWVEIPVNQQGKRSDALAEVLRMKLPNEVDFDADLDFCDADNNVLLRLTARRLDSCLIQKRKISGQWGHERILGSLDCDWSDLAIDVEIDFTGILVVVNGEPWAALKFDPISAMFGVRGVACRFQRRRTKQPLSQKPRLPRRRQGFVDELDGFVLRGQAISSEPHAPSMEIFVSGHVLDIPPIVWLHDTSSSTDDSGLFHYAFEFEIPGTVWAPPSGAPEIPVEVRLEGAAIEPLGLVLTRAYAIKTLIKASREGNATPDALHRSLLAIEHISFGDFLPELTPGAVKYFEDFAFRLGLSDFLDRNNPNRAGTALIAATIGVNDPDRQAVIQALRLLNQRVSTEDAPILEVAMCLAREHNLSGDPLRQFYLSLLPQLCRTDELQDLLAIFPVSGPADQDNSWSLTIAAAVHAAGHRVKQATDALKKLTNPSEGWLNTACIAFAVREIETNIKSYAVAEQDLLDFRYAVLGVFDTLGSDWFGRLHDAEMVETMLLMLRCWVRFPDYFAHDLERAALKHYGLSPTFWRSWRQNVPESTPLLCQAKEHFTQLATAVARPGQVDTALASITDSLRFFHSHRNPEALVWMREVAAQVMRPENTADASEVNALLATIVDIEPGDAVRFAAMPGSVDATDRLTAVTPRAAIERAVRRILGCSGNSFLYTQREICRLARGGFPALFKQDETSELIDVLSTSWSGYVGAEFLAALAIDGSGPSALGRFERLLLRFLGDDIDSSCLPSSIVDGLSRLASSTLISQSSASATLLQQMLDKVAARFAGVHDRALTLVASPAMVTNEAIIGGDVLVVVYSCNAYLDSRISAIRQGWLADLKARGISCVVLVGNGDDRLDGDVLRLAVSDLYDDLPAKTLAMVRWVISHTNFRHLIKVDDDCYLHVENYFGTLEYRAHHYYGRRVIREVVGATDRTWHHKKGAADVVKRIDMSPEPSIYADGGGVYCLSRFAMTRLLDAVAMRDGQRIIAHSFMEDKLIGDLLRLVGLTPSNVDYGSYQRRRTFPQAIPVGMWEDSFFPSRLSPTKVVHLDRAQDQALAHALRNKTELAPKKLWPTFKSVSTHWQTAQLELISDPEKLKKAIGEPVGVVCVVRNEMLMLPHLLTHYRALGVKSFFFIDNMSDDGSREYLAAQPDAVLYSAWMDYRESHFGVAWQHAVISQHFLGRWVVVADADEFLIYPYWRDRLLTEFVAEVEKEGADTVPLWMIDMYPFGSLDEADFSFAPPFEAAPWFDREPILSYRLSRSFYSNQVQHVSSLRHRLMPDSEPDNFVGEKNALFCYRPWMRFSEGLHGAANVRRSSQHGKFAHFKYHKGFRRKVVEEIARKQHFADAVEYRRYAALLAEGCGNFGDPERSTIFGLDGFSPKEKSLVSGG